MIVTEITEVDGVIFVPVNDCYNMVYILKKRIGLLSKSGIFYSSALSKEGLTDYREFESLKQLAKWITQKVLTELI